MFVKPPFSIHIDIPVMNSTSNVLSLLLTRMKPRGTMSDCSSMSSIDCGRRRCNQLSDPQGIFIDHEQTIYIADCWNHRILVWSCNNKQGFVVAGGFGKGDGLEQLSEPQGIVIAQMGRIYNNHRVMCWEKEDKHGRIVFRGQGKGERLDQLHYPRGLALDKRGYLYVVDCGNHRVQHFQVQ